MIRFPTRTLVLMGLALLAFLWMYVQTHRSAPPPTPPLKARVVAPQVDLERPAAGGDR